MSRLEAPRCGSFLEFGIIGVESDDIVALATETDALIGIMRPVVVVEIPTDER
ncbi:hypothetical protein ACOJIV_17695 [Haloarcula sp. AONF1]